MGWLTTSLNRSIGKKFVMALTGSLLMLFLIIHLIGNLTLYGGREAFNGYVETLDAVKPVVRVIEVILALIFIYHIFNGVRLWWENKKAKPDKYAINANKEITTFSSRTTIITGSIIFIFLVLHLSTFWYQFNISGHPQTGEFEFYDIVIYWFNQPVYSITYIIAVLLLGFHLNHGFQSAFQTFGWNKKRYFPTIKLIGTIYALIISLGFASIPIYFLLTGGK